MFEPFKHCPGCGGRMTRKPYLIPPLGEVLTYDKPVPENAGEIVWWWTCVDCGARMTCREEPTR
jgi:hypothetical protein